MVGFTSTQARAKEAAPSARCEAGQDEDVATKPLSASTPLTADQVDKMYHLLAEIHAITTAQLAEFRARTGQPKPIMIPSMIRPVSSLPTDFLTLALPWWQHQRGEPQAHHQARQGGEGALTERRAQCTRHGECSDSF
jgi:hypothetical protein